MLSNYRNKVPFQITLHVFIWLLLLLFPYFLSHNESADFIRQLKYTWIPMFFYAVIFYLNYFIFNEKILFKRKTLLFVAINLSLILVFIFIHHEIRNLLNTVSEAKPSSDIIKHRTPPIELFIYKDIISMIIPIIISIAVKTTEKWAKVEAEKKENEKELLKSELQHLKYQLQPHFFFNSLNTIYALIENSPELAQETVHNLSKLMRYLLYETESGKVKLSDEIEFMKQYINLMKLRISDKTKIVVNFPILNEQHYITPLLFISLIENAFKHGVSSTQKSEIFFSLSVDEKNTVRFNAKNKNFPKNENDKSGSGIGLNNLRKQLELSYPGKYKFGAEIEGDFFSTILEVYTD